MEQYDVIVIGAGAAGLMCAAQAGARARRVLVVDHATKPGRKILMSGGGRCNFTNLYVEAENYLCSNPHFVKSALNQYTQWDFIAMVERYGIAYHERDHGQLFCDDSSRQILNMLLEECRQSGVQLQTGCEIESVDADDGYQLQTSAGGLRCSALVVATGGLSIPTTGATGLGYEIARQFGIDILPVRAGLVPFTFSDQMKSLCQELSGTTLRVSMRCGRQMFTENLLFTHRGLSGPAVLQLSNYWQPGEMVTINLLPDEDAVQLLQMFKLQQPRSRLRTQLAQRLPKKLVQGLQTLIWPRWSEAALAEIPDKVLQEIAQALSDWQLKPSGTEGYRTAEVTLGGVNTDAVSSKTLECRQQPGLFFIGEVLDVTGHLGGYNFQWAWSSGYCAGQAV